MTDETAAQPAKKRKIEVTHMIAGIQTEADHYRGWARAVTEGSSAELMRRADVLEAAATVVANAELAIAFVRERAGEFKRWRDGRSS